MTRPTFDAQDGTILAMRTLRRAQFTKPRIGDFVQMTDGTLRRFTHAWGEDETTELQTTCKDQHGSFYLAHDGCVSYSGALDPAIPAAELTHISDRLGAFWFFHHDSARAHNGVDFEAPCRIYAHTPKGNDQ